LRKCAKSWEIMGKHNTVLESMRKFEKMLKCAKCAKSSESMRKYKNVWESVGKYGEAEKVC